MVLERKSMLSRLSCRNWSSARVVEPTTTRRRSPFSTKTDRGIFSREEGARERILSGEISKLSMDLPAFNPVVKSVFTEIPSFLVIVRELGQPILMLLIEVAGAKSVAAGRDRNQ